MHIACLLSFNLIQVESLQIQLNKRQREMKEMKTKLVYILFIITVHRLYENYKIYRPHKLMKNEGYSFQYRWKRRM